MQLSKRMSQLGTESAFEVLARAKGLQALGYDIVNLGIGLPTLVVDYLPDDAGVWFHSENGLLGMGPFPYEGDEDPQLINAGKQTVTVMPGGSIFDSARFMAAMSFW